MKAILVTTQHRGVFYGRRCEVSVEIGGYRNWRVDNGYIKAEKIEEKQTTYLSIHVGSPTSPIAQILLTAAESGAEWRAMAEGLAGAVTEVIQDKQLTCMYPDECSPANLTCAVCRLCVDLTAFDALAAKESAK